MGYYIIIKDNNLGGEKLPAKTTGLQLVAAMAKYDGNSQLHWYSFQTLGFVLRGLLREHHNALSY